jgi:hypothetical protein
MPSLAETQSDFRRAVTQPGSAVPAMLVAPTSAAARFAIYRRHHRESLMRHVVGRFPTVAWLLGSDAMSALATAFVASHPPSRPCLAEYGAGFIEAVRASSASSLSPYLVDVAQLDWDLGDVAVAIDRPPFAITALAGHPPDSLPDLCLGLQPGLRYVRSPWPVDDLVRIRLGARPPEQLHFTPFPVHLEIRGARGSFAIGRLDSPVLDFRASLSRRETLGGAIACALEDDPDFDVSAALAALFAEGLVVDITHAPEARQ